VLTDKPEIRWAALLHDLGKAVTPFDILPSHHGHDARGVELVDTLCERYRVPKRYQSLAVIASKYHTLLHKVQTLRPSRVVSFLEELDAYRRPERFFDFITVCKADALGRLGDIKKYTQADYLLSIYHELKSISLDSETKMQMKGQEIKQLIYQKRIKKTKQWIKEKS
jgi:tRNA nucleotidyltransferase (CCA-adding enzyme)